MAIGIAATVDHLIEYQETDDSDLENRLASLELNLEENFGQLQQWWLLRMIYTKRPLLEKMTLFWHGLLTSSRRKVGRGPAMPDQNMLLREHALGSYDVLLKAISRDPAMLIWLDSRSNVKRAPNENYARELMELFTMGVGNYSEVDVRESSRAFTGWGLRRRSFTFNPLQHDTGTKTFLGKTGNFDGDDVTDIILEQRASWEFIARKLFVFFVHDDPEPQVISRLATTFRDSGYSIKAVMREMLMSSEFYSEKAYRAQVKSPAELVVGTLRMLKIETDGRLGGRQLGNYTQLMGQTLFDPFDVSGWEGGSAWINSGAMLHRLNFANDVVAAHQRTLQFSPFQILSTKFGEATAEKGTDYFASILLDANITQEHRDRVIDYVHASSTVRADRTLDEKYRSVVYLLLASPEYQLA
ncbi:DUF1800 domain-containing protein [Dehalococcoidia bacterium]|nr:DUF1800 domain-containing protein [Dehalococcoidia bacterium]